jgi:hypothetical protein
MSKNTGNSTIIGISLFTYGKQRWEEISCSHKYNSLTLNLIVCQKRTLNPGRISLQKRKAQLRRKRIQRKNYAKTKMQRARLTAGSLFCPCWCSTKRSTPLLCLVYGQSRQARDQQQELLETLISIFFCPRCCSTKRSTPLLCLVCRQSRQARDQQQEL